MDKLTPMIRQYLEIKGEHRDAILFFRLGDFYEMFFEDAEIASRELGLALTTRDKRQDNPVPLCGVPHHAASQYIAKLLKKGYKVAICEQVEDPRLARGIVKREVVRIITPGTDIETENISPKAGNFLASVNPGRNSIGLACVDLSTAEFRMTELPELEQLLEELLRVDPREVLLPEGSEEFICSLKAALGGVLITERERKDFDYRSSQELFQRMEIRGAEDEMKEGVGAAGAAVRYLQELSLIHI